MNGDGWWVSWDRERDSIEEKRRHCQTETSDCTNKEICVLCNRWGKKEDFQIKFSLETASTNVIRCGKLSHAAVLNFIIRLSRNKSLINFQGENGEKAFSCCKFNHCSADNIEMALTLFKWSRAEGLKWNVSFHFKKLNSNFCGTRREAAKSFTSNVQKLRSPEKSGGFKCLRNAKKGARTYLHLKEELTRNLQVNFWLFICLLCLKFLREKCNGIRFCFGSLQENSQR